MPPLSPPLYSASPSPPRPRVVPIKFRRKSLNASDVDLDEARLSSYPVRSPPSAYMSSPPLGAYMPYAYHSSNEYSSASSSPIASSLALGSMPSSPVGRPHIRYQSSPIREPSHYAIRHPYPGEEMRPFGSSHESLLGLDSFQYGVSFGKAKLAIPSTASGHQSRACSYAYSSPSEVSEDPPFASDFEMEPSEQGGCHGSARGRASRRRRGHLAAGLAFAVASVQQDPSSSSSHVGENRPIGRTLLRCSPSTIDKYSELRCCK
ncbi:hypothetical protein DAEQUDRAFT_532022 [Daedalea quercina L-15889]|uniref:Uncharacterized protein n=1 Tax=Daedalea quercina L-15889 TaxID=1314783 RepID=A0A165M8X8_9APHY|nr:hypothetical protein DAEQUDRAFT_532022 [Daedalea quercina L-15889]